MASVSAVSDSRVLEQHDRRDREQRGAEDDHAGAAVHGRARCRAPSQSARIDGCITAAASSRYAIGQSASSDAAVGVGAVGDEACVQRRRPPA